MTAAGVAFSPRNACTISARGIAAINARSFGRANYVNEHLAKQVRSDVRSFNALVANQTRLRTDVPALALPAQNFSGRRGSDQAAELNGQFGSSQDCNPHRRQADRTAIWASVFYIALNADGRSFRNSYAILKSTGGCVPAIRGGAM